MATANTSVPTQFIGRYEITQILGAGTYGVVYLATYNGKQYAIKQISLRHENPISALKELSFYTIMSHPRIMAPYEYILTDDGNKLNIVMHRGGSTLFHTFLTGNRATEDEIKLICYQLLQALDYLHFNGIAHRDLKPTNIIMDEMEVNIIDFGLANMIFRDKISLSLSVQTITHRAPEILENKQYGPSIDIWSLGIMLLELARGRTYFRMMTEEQMLAFINNPRNFIDTDVNKTSLSPAGKDLIRRMLRVNPEQRITAHAALQHPWLSQYTHMDPERIPLPVVVNEDALFQRWLYDPLVVRVLAKVPTEVGIYAVRLLSILNRNDPTLPIDGRVIGILNTIAAGVLDEINAKRLTIASDAGAQLVDRIFKGLNYNIFIE